MNQQLTICLIPGDGIGREVIPAAAEILAALGLGLRFVESQAGFWHFRQKGNALPDETLADVEAARVALFGATASPLELVPGYQSPILTLRKTFDLYANLRPVSSLPGTFSRQGIDLLIVRENTEGLYAGRERRQGQMAVAERVITEFGSERIARTAFEQALKRQVTSGFFRQTDSAQRLPVRLTIVHKANVLKLTDGLFRDTCLRVAQGYPGVLVDEMLVDAMAMRLVRDPENFDVMVTTNLFGDILSDEAGALIGGLGVVPSANIGRNVAIFEPVHGAAPDIAGMGIANPLGAIFSATMLLEHAGLTESAIRLKAAVYRTLMAGIVSPDLGGKSTTTEITRRIISELV